MTTAYSSAYFLHLEFSQILNGAEPVIVSCQVPGAHAFLLSEAKGRRKGGFSQHLLLRLV